MTADDGSTERHEPAYAEWLTANPQGFVLLMNTYKIHRATCSSVRPLRAAARRRGICGGMVFCSVGRAPLEYALLQFEGAVRTCNRCKPGSDPVGVSMHAQYAASMHAHLAEERSNTTGAALGR